MSETRDEQETSETEQTSIPVWKDDTGQDRMMQGGWGESWVGGRGWAQSEGKRGVCVFKGSLALNLFHMTHTHMASVWTLPGFVCLSVCLSLSWVVRSRKGGGWRRGGGGYFPATTGALWWQGPGQCHTPGLVVRLIMQKGFQSRSSLLPLSSKSMAAEHRSYLSHRKPEQAHLRSLSALRSQRGEPENLNQHISSSRETGLKLRSCLTGEHLPVA